MNNQKRLLLFPYLLIIYDIAVYLSNDMYLPSMPAIAKDLGLSADQIQSTLTLWFLGASSLQFILGPVSDRYGRKNVLVIGGLIFVTASVVCAITDNLTIMLIARFFQGAATCSLVAGYAAIHELFSSRRAVKLLAMISAVTILAPALGPLFGALIIQFAIWRYIFWVLAAIGLFGTISLLLYMPDSINQSHSLNVKLIANHYIKILCNKNFMLANMSYSFLLTTFFLWMFESPFIIINTYQKSTLFYGVAQTLIFSCFLISAALTKWAVDKYRVVDIVTVFTALSIVGTVLFLLNAIFYSNINFAIAAMMVISIGSSMLFGLISRVAINSAAEPMGMRTAVFSTTFGLFGFITGVVLGLIESKSLLSISILSLICISVATVLIYFTDLPDFSDD